MRRCLSWSRSNDAVHSLVACTGVCGASQRATGPTPRLSIQAHFCGQDPGIGGVFMWRNPCILFTILDKAHSRMLAGVIGLINVSAAQLRVEIAWVLVFPAFWHTYVTSNAIRILLQHILELPLPLPKPSARRGLGFQHVQWMAPSTNQPSQALAMCMGLKHEGVLRWT
jgi:hypothetical protein